ncbi:MAG: tyrosine-type recombinase/integrase [Rhodothermales bacterium]
MRLLLSYLREDGVVAEQAVAGTIDNELARFDTYLDHERGLALNTRAQRLRIIGAFLQASAGAGLDPLELPPISAGDLRRFIKQTLQRWSRNSARVLVATLRSYLQFRAYCGDQVDHLTPVVTSPANWRLSALPETLSPEEVAQLLEPFPPEVPSRFRAYAMVRCVVDLGLRANEVVRLDLNDIDWYAGTIRIGPNKARRIDTMPLPQLTGRAIAQYISSERPQTANRCVFVRHVAPFDVPIGPGVVRRAVRSAYRRLGLSHTRIHVLRHTLAGRLLEGGSPLKEVADVLRHRALDTTLIYAKIDTTHLAAVALPWPEDAS